MADAMLVPVAHLAKIFSLTERRIQQLASDGIIPKAERGKYHFIDSIRGYVTFLQERAYGKIESGTDSHHEKTRVLKAQADILELKLDRESSKILNIEDVEQGLSEMLTILKKRIEGLPQEIQEKLEKHHDTTINADIIEELVRSVLNELAENAPQFESDNAESVEMFDTDADYLNEGVG